MANKPEAVGDSNRYVKITWHKDDLTWYLGIPSAGSFKYLSAAKIWIFFSMIFWLCKVGNQVESQTTKTQKFPYVFGWNLFQTYLSHLCTGCSSWINTGFMGNVSSTFVSELETYSGSDVTLRPPYCEWWSVSWCSFVYFLGGCPNLVTLWAAGSELDPERNMTEMEMRVKTQLPQNTKVNEYPACNKKGWHINSGSW